MRANLTTVATLAGFAASSVCAAAPRPSGACASCHPNEVAAYAKTAMAHSLSNEFRLPPGTFIHEASGTRFSFASNHDPAEITFARGRISGKYEAAWVIGSGSRAFGVIIRNGDYLFQAPVSYYVQRASWNIAPGFESATAPDFNRPVTAECLYCHSDRARPVPETLNRYYDPPFSAEAISCGRCHGDPAAHLRNPRPGNIVNPANLPPVARDSICEQCHLSGEARILNPGREWSDFKPGENLEQTFSAYVRDGSRDNSIKVISHAEQLALSRCARESGGRLWCGACHDPHREPADPVSYYRERCLECHGSALLKTHAKPADNCIGCHMPKREARDGGHTAFTDHLISRAPRFDVQAGAPVEKLRAWREPAGALALRNIGLANVEAGLRLPSSALVARGGALLEQALKSYPRDRAVLTDLGLVLMRNGQNRDAIRLFELALAGAPGNAIAHVNLGNAYKQAGMYEKAAAELNKAIELDVSLQDAYRSLVEIYLSAKNPDAAQGTLERYLRFMPQSIAARTALAH